MKHDGFSFSDAVLGWVIIYPERLDFSNENLCVENTS